MEKLIYTHFWGDEGCSGTSHIAFEYESKDKFVFDTLEKFGTEFENKVLVFKESIACFNIGDVYLDKYEVAAIEHDTRTLEEWFEREKINTHS